MMAACWTISALCFALSGLMPPHNYPYADAIRLTLALLFAILAVRS